MGDDKDFPCTSHACTHTPQLPSPHQTWHIPKAVAIKASSLSSWRWPCSRPICIPTHGAHSEVSLSGDFEQRPSTQAPLPRPEDPFLHSDSALSPSHAQASLPSTPGPRPVRPQGPSAQGSPGRETRPETALISLTPRAGPWNSRVSVLSRVWASCITTVK